MKKQLSLLLVLTLAIMFPQIASAHSHYQSSTPGDEEEVSDVVTEISVTFDGSIATGDLTVWNEETDEEVEVGNVDVEDTSITAQLDEPLVNGTYRVDWENIGADTHAIDGSFSFTVETPEDATPEDELTAEEDAANNAEESNDETTQSETVSETEETESGSTVLWISVILGALFIIGLIIFAVSRNKKQ